RQALRALDADAFPPGRRGALAREALLGLLALELAAEYEQAVHFAGAAAGGDAVLRARCGEKHVQLVRLDSGNSLALAHAGILLVLLHLPRLAGSRRGAGGLAAEGLVGVDAGARRIEVPGVP